MLLRFLLPPIVLPASLAPAGETPDPAVVYAGMEAPADLVIPMVMPVEPVWHWADLALPLFEALLSDQGVPPTIQQRVGSFYSGLAPDRAQKLGERLQAQARARAGTVAK